MKTFFLSLIGIMAFAFVQAQTADDIIAKHVDALGGSDKLSQIKSVYIESTTEVMGNQSSSKTSIVNGKGFKSESDFNGQSIVTTVTDKGGWAINPFTGSSDATAMPAEQYKTVEDGIYLPDPLFNYAAHGAKVTLDGQQKVNDVNAYKLKYTNKDGDESTYFIDPNTWYVIQSVKKGMMRGEEIEVTTSYSDYKKTDFGTVIPYSTSIDMGQFGLKVNVNKVEINKDIDMNIFEMPK
jgi:hypothetical protein